MGIVAEVRQDTFRAVGNDADAPLLRMANIVKTFGDHAVVNEVSVDIFAGRVLALLGENGAGKSTLIKVLAGVYTKDAGQIYFDQKPIDSALSIKRGNAQPIAFIHQDLGLVEWMSVAENMALTMGFPTSFGSVSWVKVKEQAEKALAEVGIALNVDARVFELSRTEKSLLAIARAVAVHAKVLVLDEPTASLPADDVRHLFTVIKELKTQGVGMIYVTHRLDEVIEIADDICVMRDGFYVAGGKAASYALPDLVHAIVGTETKKTMRALCPKNADNLLTLNQLMIGETGPVSFTLKRGEMLGLVGLRGAGQEEIGRALFGLREISAGNIQFKNAAFTVSSPEMAIKAGISLVAGDRLQEGAIGVLQVIENLFINPCASGYNALSSYSLTEEKTRGAEKAERFDIRPKNVAVDMSSLSGGNQQKVIMARWLALKSDLIILEDPTSGVDVGARADIYRLLNEVLATGISILVVSTDFEEVALICNRAIVFNRGEMVGELEGEQVSFANLLALSCGGKMS